MSLNISYVDAKVASNDALLALLEDIPDNLLKAVLFRHILEEGLTLRERNVIEAVLQKSAHLMIHPDLETEFWTRKNPPTEN